MKRSLVALIGLCAASVAMADEVDFYIFKTTHGETANKTAKFKTYVRRTHLLNYRIDDQDEYKCVVTPAAPENYNCKINGTGVVLHDSESSARAVLEQHYKVATSSIKEFKKVNKGIYQAVLKDDTIYHVTMDAPAVLDDSMECVLSVIEIKKLATLTCNSEFQADLSFTVRELPIYVSDSGSNYTFGVAPPYRYWDTDETARHNETNKEAIAKVRQVLDGISRLKKFGPLADGKTAYSFRLNVQKASYYNRLSWSGGRSDSNEVRAFEVDGEVEHLNKGNLRRGD